jgi:hypothetical protein
MPKTLEERLREHGEDFVRADDIGKPFTHFFCPILWVDEDVRLCMGHVVNQALGRSSKAQVVQRHDVDSWYAGVAEEDFQTLVKTRETDLVGAFLDPELNKKTKPCVIFDGKVIPHYLIPRESDEDVRPRGHTRIRLERLGGAPGAMDLVVKIAKAELAAQPDKKLGVVLARDYRVAALVSLIKAAHLTMFHLCGYRYALSAAGRYVGHDILGTFYLENRDKGIREARSLTTDYFREYVNMVRPVDKIVGGDSVGTVDDGCAFVCVNSNNVPFAQGVYVRTNDILNMVLLPHFAETDSVPAYLRFMANDVDDVEILHVVFDRERMAWHAGNRVRMKWPKQHPTFRLR